MWHFLSVVAQASGRPSLHVSNNPRGGGAGSASAGRTLKKGDRVRFIGTAGRPTAAAASGLPVPSSVFGISAARSSAAAGKAGASTHRGPFYNCPGQVVLTFDNKPGKVGVRFDYGFAGGTSLGDLCEDSMGYWCSVSDLRLEGTSKAEEREGAAIDALFDVAGEQAAKGPVVIYVKVRAQNLQRVPKSGCGAVSSASVTLSCFCGSRTECQMLPIY